MCNLIYPSYSRHIVYKEAIGIENITWSPFCKEIFNGLDSLLLPYPLEIIVMSPKKSLI